MTTVPETAPTGDLALARMVSHFALIEPIFDTMADVVFFVKDAQARYVLANRTLASRCGLGNKRDRLGKTAEQVFPARFGRIYTAQAQAVVPNGNTLIDQLEQIGQQSGRER